jgi:hypothetical protein
MVKYDLGLRIKDYRASPVNVVRSLLGRWAIQLKPGSRCIIGTSILIIYSTKSRYMYSKPLDNLATVNPDWNMKCCSQLSTYFKPCMAFRKADQSLVCPDKILQFLQTCIKTSTTSESSINE